VCKVFAYSICSKHNKLYGMFVCIFHNNYFKIKVTFTNVNISAYRIFQNKIPTCDNLIKKRDMQLSQMICVMCETQTESIDNLILTWMIVRKMYDK